MDLVAEALASSLLEVVLGKLNTSLLEYAKKLKVDTKALEKWRTTTLPEIKAVLRDAERRQIQEDEEVIGWLDDLKALTFDIEDVLDEIHTEADQRRSLVVGPQGQTTATTSKVRKLIPSFNVFSKMTFNTKIGEKIKTINNELDAIVERKSILNLLTEDVGGPSSHRTRGRHQVGAAPSINQERQTTSLVKESEVYGRAADREKIVNLLLSEEVAAAPKVEVIPIVGMGGVGKTTLAQFIYNDEKVKKNFPIRGWACVSDQFCLETITKQLLESVSKRSSNSQSSLQLLQTRLHEELNGKKFFLVLDDIWMVAPDKWNDLQAPLKDGKPGSVIVVTTRDETVASIVGTACIQPLSELTEEDSWSLFARIAFENTTPDARQSLGPIGRRIIKKCKGLPLAVTTLARLLRSKQDEKTWEKMLRNEIWDLSPQQSSILPVLRLSYHYLPSVLKQCFAYCSIFPKDYVFDKEELILLWAAQGFFGRRDGETIKDVGEGYFDELLSRSFFQRSGGDYSSFVMHDLIRDLARFVSRNSCLTLDVEGQDKISERTRHVSYIREQYDVSKRFDPLLKTHKLRTFLPVRMPFLPFCNLADKILNDLLPTLECLRVLSLSCYDITHLPDSFRHLQHLRYLNLSYTAIKRLPPSICELLNLQSLVLLCCSGLTELPDEIGKLVNLIHLDVSGTKIQGMPAEIGKLANLLYLDVSKTNLEGMPKGINKLKDLRILTNFVVGKHSGASIAELQDLSHLQGALSILKLQNVVNAMDASEADLKNKKGLDDLEFAWDGDVVVGDLNNQTEILEKLQPHTKVERLSIQHYNGTKFPKWLGDPSFMNLVFLQLKDCKRCSSLPPLGQLQSLKDLQIVKLNEVRKVGAEFYGYGSSNSIKPFGSLEILRFEEMSEWEEWVFCGVEFPCLKELYVENCPKLRGDLSKCLPQSTKIEISKCGKLMCCLPMAPSIRDLELRECDDVMVRSTGGLTSLASLKLWNVCKIPSELGQLHCLVRLCVYGCPELKEIPPILQNLTSLEYLEINQCENLLSFSEMMGLPPVLENLCVCYCPSLESLPEAMMQNNNSTLQSLLIRGCDSLSSMPRNMNLLKNLSICWCKKLDLAFGEDMTQDHYASLTSLVIDDCCPSLVSFPLTYFTKLERLCIRKCRNLERLDIPDGLHHVDHLITSLQSLDIRDCSELVSFPQGGLATPNLRRLNITGCDKLRSLPQRMHALLTSLEVLVIDSCRQIGSFPDGGLPTNLSELYISNCRTLMTRPVGWGLQTCSCLRRLTIQGHKERGYERFGLSPLTNLKCLENNGLQHLTSLEISSFPNLISLDDKEFQHLTSLKTLVIEHCDKLKFLPKQGLPSSLSRLCIANCYMLKRQCERNKGEEWPKISHIPCIENGEVILS